MEKNSVKLFAPIVERIWSVVVVAGFCTYIILA